MSRTVADRRRQSRSITSASSGPRNFSSAFSGRRRRRRSGLPTARLSSAAASDVPGGAAPQQLRVPLARALAAVRESDVQLHDEMAVTRLVQRSARSLTPLDHPRERHRRQLTLGVGLIESRPDRRSLRGLFADREGVQEPEAPSVREPLQGVRGTLVVVVAGALVERRIAREEIEVPVFDRHFAPPDLRQTSRRLVPHTTSVSYVTDPYPAATGVSAAPEAGEPPPATAFRMTALTTRAAPTNIRPLTGSPSQNVPMRIASAGMSTWVREAVVGRSFR